MERSTFFSSAYVSHRDKALKLTTRQQTWADTVAFVPLSAAEPHSLGIGGNQDLWKSSTFVETVPLFVNHVVPNYKWRLCSRVKIWWCCSRSSFFLPKSSETLKTLSSNGVWPSQPGPSFGDEREERTIGGCLRSASYLWHLRPEVDLLQVDGLGSEVVEQMAQEDSIPEGLSQVKYLSRVPRNPVVSWEHLAVYQPQRALPPVLHHYCDFGRESFRRFL